MYPELPGAVSGRLRSMIHGVAPDEADPFLLHLVTDHASTGFTKRRLKVKNITATPT